MKMKSEVYFIKIDSNDTEKRIGALKKLLEKIDPFALYKKDELIPVKLTIGDSACTYHISPELVKAAILKIREKGAKPFIFDTSVIYKGERQNAVDHMNLAQSKGFGHTKVLAPFIVADGLLGMDGKEYEINEPDIKRIRVPSFVGMLDSLVVLSHATGHIVSGYAGAIKNVAMGMACRPTKRVQHSSIKPNVIEKKCTSCGCCIRICPVNAIAFKGQKAFIDQSICIGCGECLCACKFNSIFIDWHEDPHLFCRRMVDVANFILPKFKNRFFITFALDITRECDCISTKDEPMVARNIGILASSDIVAIDKATTDLANEGHSSQFFSNIEPFYEKMYQYAAKKGMGNMEYDIINI